MNAFSGLLYLLFCIATAMIGMQIHHNLFFAIINFCFAPLSWVYWLLTHSVTLSVIKQAFSWFFV